MNKLRNLNPHKGEIVNIKFKSINEIMEASKSGFHETEEKYSISENMKAYIAGGHFLVSEEFDQDDEIDNSIGITNHLDASWNFYIYDEVIESIEIVAESESFCSKDHKIMVVRVDNEMFINGQPLIWDEDVKEKEQVHRNTINQVKVEYENPNRKLLKIFENYIADLALSESFNSGEQE